MFPIQREPVKQPAHNLHISANHAIDTILGLSEIREDDDYIRKATKGKRHLSGMIYGSPDKLHPYWWVVIGEDNGMAFVTHFTFYVYSNGRKIMYYDNLSDSSIDLSVWRLRYHKK